MAKSINFRGLLLLIQEVIIDALIAYKTGADGWLVEHFDETIYALLTPITSRQLKMTAEKMPVFSNRTQVKRWLFEKKVANFVEMEKLVSPSRLSKVFGISRTQACMALKKMCNEGKLHQIAIGRYGYGK